ncbi:probable leucine-zipper-like transcriptional regulator 1 at N-terminal half [Coccomyxa sp. Obi]|nr:probable leucine-zipper-like transcriptional regulator 1 at N-terminal half [Coccomyxa sp. Obi]
MMQNGDDRWSKDRLDVLEEIRILGNNFYRCQQYRAAALLYRTGLGLIAPGDITPTTVGGTVAKDVPEEVDMQYLTLSINLAQALLNIPPRDMHRELAAMDASEICEAAYVHLHWFLLKWHNIRYAEFVRQLQLTTCSPKLAHLGGLLAKARSRRSIALERCGNITGALNDFENALGRVPADETEQDRLERIALGFASPTNGLPLPKEATRIFSRPLECCHRAAVKFYDTPNVDAKQCPTPLGRMVAAFPCGKYRESAMFVMSYLRADESERLGYIIGNWGCTGEQMTHCVWAAYTPKHQNNFQSGAVLGSVLYCISLDPDCCEMRGFHLLSSYNISAGFQAPLNWASPTEVTLARRSAALVACCGALYLFGGCILESTESSDRVASQDLILFIPNLSDLSVECSLIQTGSTPPLARWGHATFVHGAHIYIFGGMYEHRGNSKAWDMYLGDMWRFDVNTGEWTRVDFLSCVPCARANTGVAFDERRAMIVGGVTANADGRRIYLADVWEFDFESCCWIQVVPEKPSEEPWISARSAAACSLVDNNTLVTLYGVCNYGPVGRDKMTTFTLKRGIGAKIAARAGNSGPHRDGALICSFADMAAMKSQVAELPDWLRSFYTAPVGSVNLLAVRSLDLLEGAFTPLFKSMTAYKTILPSDCIFSPESITPIRPLGGNPGNMWGSTECPFDVAPRWLNAPLEVSVNLAAVEYFRLCQPQVHLYEWQHIKVLHEDTERAAVMGWQVQECEAFVLQDPLSCRQQIYMMAVLGPIFFCFLATRCPQQTSNPASLIGSILFKLQVYALCVPGSMVSTYCHHCGKRDPRGALRDTKARPNIMTKVCKGCHLVRYCGSDCQHADWEAPFGHKEVCKKYASCLLDREQ